MNVTTAPVVTVAELQEQAARGHDFFLLDVRTGPEFIAGRLSFTDALIPYDVLADHLDALPADKTCPIYSFCRSGRRSGITTQLLRSVGYVNAFNVKGGIIAWVDAGYPTEAGPISSVAE